MKPQTIFRNGRADRGYTKISNVLLDDDVISPDCMYVLVRILRLPSDWTFNTSWMRKKFNMGRDRLYAVLREAGELGYCRRIDHRGPAGGIVKVEYVFTDDPSALPEPVAVEDTTEAGNLLPENPEGAENLLPENPTSWKSGRILKTITKNQQLFREKSSAPACTQDEKPKPEPEIRLTGGKVVLSASARTFWLQQFGGDSARLDLALIEAGCNIQSNSRSAVELQITRQLARIAGDKRDRDARYAAAAPKASRRSNGQPADKPKLGPVAAYLAQLKQGEKIQ